MANLEIEFTHLPSRKVVKFTAFLETFNDSYSAEWSSDKVFGRMDPIAQYKGTTRKINISFTVPSESHEQAYVNHSKISLLLQMMYPNYEFTSTTQVYTITAPPLMRVKFNNLIRNAQLEQYGLMGYITELKYDPDLNSNIFSLSKETLNPFDILSYVDPGTVQRDQPPAKVDALRQKLPDADKAIIAFQSFKIGFDFNVLHTHALGFDNGATFNQPIFPYSFQILGK
jgi:hypothetical protein